MPFKHYSPTVFVNLSAAPSSPVVGETYYDTTLKALGVYCSSLSGFGWQYSSLLYLNPIGRVRSSVACNFSTTYAAVGCSSGITSDYLLGGMTAVSAALTNIGVVVPIAGFYRVSGNVYAQSNASGQQVGCGHSGRTGGPLGESAISTATGQGLLCGFSDILSLTAGATVTLWGYAPSGTTSAGWVAASQNTLCVDLVSRNQ